MTNEWDDLADWWREELETDPTYVEVVVPLLLAMLATRTGTVLDVGCGNGRIMGELALAGLEPVGCDINTSLLAEAAKFGPVMRLELPGLPIRRASMDGAVVVLSFEHLENEIFSELARVIRPGGWLVAVANHPFITAPDSASVIDPTDGEVFWRPGTYLDAGSSIEDANGQPVTFLHRPIGEFLTTAAKAGFSLNELREVPFEPGGLPDAGLPRLIGVRWARQ
ncbi:MAG: class I SAM-dependent methyltransferase [Acidimicrobiia bacterium]|nr:class I SAM-dependent methyltransferase [Acidimicrobiia bacterium]